MLLRGVFRNWHGNCNRFQKISITPCDFIVGRVALFFAVLPGKVKQRYRIEIDFEFGKLWIYRDMMTIVVMETRNTIYDLMTEEKCFSS